LTNNAGESLGISMFSRIIRAPQTLKQLNIPGVECLQVKWAPHYAYALNTIRALETPHHPKHEQSKRRWQTRTDPLWWNCLVSTKVGGSRKIVRGWLNNRARVAITEALKRKGYARNGARLVEESQNRMVGDLVGSAHFLVNPQMLHTSWPSLQEQADRIVTAIENEQKKLAGLPQANKRSKVAAGKKRIASGLIKRVER
jgi:hypothetical protein